MGYILSFASKTLWDTETCFSFHATNAQRTPHVNTHSLKQQSNNRQASLSGWKKSELTMKDINIQLLSVYADLSFLSKRSM